jgi:hypothetical protein
MYQNNIKIKKIKNFQTRKYVFYISLAKANPKQTDPTVQLTF